MNTQKEKEYVLVTERFHPDSTSSTGQYMTDLAIGLEDRGLDMTVYTRKFSHNDTETLPEDTEISVFRVPIPDISQESFLGRLVNWLTFMSVVIPMLLLSRPEKQREVIFVTYPTVLPPIMWCICRLRNWEFTYIVYDYYPEFAVSLNYISRGGLIHRIWDTINRKILRDAKNIVALGPVMRRRIIESAPSGINEDKVSIIHNWADGEFIKPRSKDENWFSIKHDLVDTFSLVYSGNTGVYHDIETVIKAIAEMDDSSVRLLVIGEGDNKENLIDLADSLDVLGEKVSFLPYQPWEDVPYSFTSGDVSVVAVNEESKGLCVSSKLYSAFASGQPILVISDSEDDEAQLVEQFNAGKNVEPDDTDGVIAAIQEWMSNPDLVDLHGSNARHAFEDHFTKEQSIDEYYYMIK